MSCLKQYKELTMQYFIQYLFIKEKFVNILQEFAVSLPCSSGLLNLTPNQSKIVVHGEIVLTWWCMVARKQLCI